MNDYDYESRIENARENACCAQDADQHAEAAVWELVATTLEIGRHHAQLLERFIEKPKGAGGGVL